MMQASSAARRPGTERVPSRQNGGAVRRRRGTWDRVAAQFPWQVRGGSQPTYHEPEPLEGSWLGTLAKAVAVAAVFAAYVVVCVVLTVPDRLAIGLFALALVGAVAWFGWRLADADSVIDSLNAALIAVFVFYAAGGFILTIPFGWRAHLLPWGALVTAVVVSLVQRLCRRHRVTEWTPLRRDRPAGAGGRGRENSDAGVGAVGAPGHDYRPRSSGERWATPSRTLLPPVKPPRSHRAPR